MEGLILIWSIKNSNHIAMTQWPQGIVASYRRALRGVAKILRAHLRKSDSENEPALIEEIMEDDPQD